MRNTQGLKEFVLKWRDSKRPCKEILYEYKPFCSELMYEDEDLVRETTLILRDNISGWAKLHSPVYASRRGLFHKGSLQDKKAWYVQSMESEAMGMATSGSTTGQPFSYLRWEPFLYFIEATNHYDLIMDEFSVKEEPDVMYFFNTGRWDKDKVVTVSSESDNFMEHHGTKRRARVHYINFEMMNNDRESYFKEVVSYLISNSLDVVFAPGPSVRSLCDEMRRIGVDRRIFGLLSNSNEKIMQEDASYLLSGRVDHVCDHMRCWDGGATFFTCRAGNYHLMDNLSWCQEVDRRLICTDYFSLPSPFVEYWNGDFCRITDRYERCECGRLYRDFEFLDSRPFSLKGSSMLELKKALLSLGVRDVVQVRCSSDSVEVVSRSPVREDHRMILSGRFRFDLKFTVENEDRTTQRE